MFQPRINTYRRNRILSARPRLETLEDRTVPATLDIAGGALTLIDSGTENNNITITKGAAGYSINDTGAVITLTPDAVAAGWKGGGTNTVSGPLTSVTGSFSVDLGGGTNILNIRGINNTTSVTATGGTSTVNISSNAPLNTGNMAAIGSNPITVTGGTSTTLNVANVTAASTGTIGITATAITGLADSTITYSGTLAALTVRGSNVGTLVETYTVTSPAATNFTLQTFGGNDTVNVVSTTGIALINTGAGNDIVNVTADGVGGALTVNTGAGSSAVNFNDATSNTAGQVTATQLLNMAGTGNDQPVTLATSGGTLALNLNFTDDSASNTVNFTATPASFVSFITATGSAGVDNFTVASGVTVPGTFDMGAGDNVVTINGTLDAGLATNNAIVAGAGKDSITVAAGGSVTGKIDAGDGGTSDTPGTTEQTVTINGTVTGDVSTGDGVDIISISGQVNGNVNGGNGDNTYVLSGSSTNITGTLVGGTGLDFLNLSGRTGTVAVGLTTAVADQQFTGTATGITGTFSGIGKLQGNGATSTLTGIHAAATWTLSATPTVAYDSPAKTLSFVQNSFQTINGGSAADTFNVTANTTATLNGNAGADEFTVDASVMLTGSIDAGDGDNVVTINGTVTGDVSTGDGVDIVTVGVEGEIGGNLSTGAGNDTVILANRTTSLSVAVTGDIDLGAGDDAFTLGTFVEVTGKVLGGDGDDTFTINGTKAAGDVGTVVGGIEGGLGSDTIVADYGQITNPAGIDGLIHRDDNDPPVTFAFSEMEVVTFNTVELSGGDDIVEWKGTAWTLTQFNGAAVSPGISLGTPSTINGGAGNDTFTIDGDLGAVTLNGGAGNDTFNHTAGTVANTVTLNGGADDDALVIGAGAFNFLGTFNGGTGSDTVDVSAVAGNVPFTISSLATDGLTGSFGINPPNTGSLTGVNVITGNGVDYPGTSITYTGSAAATWAIVGGGTSTLTIGADSISFTGVFNITSGSGNDTFTVSRQDLLAASLNLNGGGGTNSLVVNNNNVDANANDYLLSGVNAFGGLSATGWADILFANFGTINLQAFTGSTLEDDAWTGTGFTSNIP
jgi:hypothetical protein